jgi:hypothetical protein
MYKQLSDIISPAIAQLFNVSVTSGVFPEHLKTGRIVPIFDNFRPVTILHTVSKIFERLMYRRIVSFLAKNKILFNKQFGFRTGHSTTDAVLQFLDHAYSCLDKGDYLCAIFLDLSKAFDTVNTDILLKKLDHMGIREVLILGFPHF